MPGLPVEMGKMCGLYGARPDVRLCRPHPRAAARIVRVRARHPGVSGVRILRHGTRGGTAASVGRGRPGRGPTLRSHLRSISRMKKLFAVATGLAALAWLAPASAILLPGKQDVKPVNLALNTPANEDDPHLTSNGLGLYYSSNGKGKWDILYTQRAAATQMWKPGAPLDDYVATNADDRSACSTREGV